MKLCPETISILENFSGINQNLYFPEGNVLGTINEDGSIFAKATIVESFEVPFGIHNLSQFLNVLKLFDDPELDFQESFVKIKKGRRSVTYVFTNPELLQKPKSLRVKQLTEDYALELSADDLKDVLKAARNLPLPHLILRGGESGASLAVCDHSNASSGEFVLELNEDPSGEYQAIFNLSDIKKIVEGSYNIVVSKKGMSKFTKKDSELAYWVALNVDSSFSE